jgi:hypothetical protein
MKRSVLAGLAAGAAIPAYGELASHDASRRAAERIPGARFVSLESGGHLMLGQQKERRDELADFLTDRRDRRAGRAAS